MIFEHKLAEKNLRDEFRDSQIKNTKFLLHRMRGSIWLSYIRTGRTRVKARSGDERNMIETRKRSRETAKYDRNLRERTTLFSLQKAAAERSRAFDPFLLNRG